MPHNLSCIFDCHATSSKAQTSRSQDSSSSQCCPSQSYGCGNCTNRLHNCWWPISILGQSVQTGKWQSLPIYFCWNSHGWTCCDVYQRWHPMPFPVEKVHKPTHKLNLWPYSWKASIEQLSSSAPFAFLSLLSLSLGGKINFEALSVRVFVRILVRGQSDSSN